jgi:hypothetical protein
MTIQDRAAELKDRLKKAYNIKTPFQFELSVNQLVGGKHNAELRREIIFLITGDKPPLTKCTPSDVSTTLENSFKQYTIF